jgi:hypothetical protein
VFGVVPTELSVKQEMERERERERVEITLVLPVLMIAFLHDLASGLEFANGSQIPAHKT